MIVVLTGPNACGKGVVVDYLKKKGFRSISFGDIVREEVRTKNLELTRANLIKTGNALREKFGAGFLARRILEIIENEMDVNWVIDGARNPAEILELKKMDNVFVLGINVNRDILVARILERQRDGDKGMSAEDIRKKLEIDWGEGQDENGQQVGRCLELADLVIWNEGSLEELEQKIELEFLELKKND